MEIEGKGIFTKRDGKGIGKNRRMFLMDNMSSFPIVQTILQYVFMTVNKS